jgi:hypothetical protein
MASEDVDGENGTEATAAGREADGKLIGKLEIAEYESKEDDVAALAEGAGSAAPSLVAKPVRPDTENAAEEGE